MQSMNAVNAAMITITVKEIAATEPMDMSIVKTGSIKVVFWSSLITSLDLISSEFNSLNHELMVYIVYRL